MDGHPVLYKRTSLIEDNATSNISKQDLDAITSPNGAQVAYKELFLDILPLVQHIAAILCFTSVFLRMHLGQCFFRSDISTHISWNVMWLQITGMEFMLRLEQQFFTFVHGLLSFTNSASEPGA